MPKTKNSRNQRLKKPKPAGPSTRNTKSAAQTRKVLGKHYANKYRVS